MRYHFSDAYKREQDDEVEEISDGLAERSDVIFKLMSIRIFELVKGVETTL